MEIGKKFFGPLKRVFSRSWGDAQTLGFKPFDQRFNARVQFWNLFEHFVNAAQEKRCCPRLIRPIKISSCWSASSLNSKESLEGEQIRLTTRLWVIRLRVDGFDQLPRKVIELQVVQVILSQSTRALGARSAGASPANMARASMAIG